jgi:hypothetical protein
MEKKVNLTNCIKCNQMIYNHYDKFHCKDCLKSNICVFCYLTGFPYPYLCLTCEDKKRNISKKNIMFKKKYDLKMKEDYLKKLNFNLYNK